MKENTTSFTIKNWSINDRPREKLLQKGKTSLTEAELIAILIGSGNQKETAVALSQRILATASNNLCELSKFSVVELTKFKGIGEAKAIAIVAALELGRRSRKEEALHRPSIRSSHSAFELLQPMLGDLPHEEFWIVYLNNANKVLESMQLSKGGLTGTVVDIRLALKRALELSAVGLILGHNHPSGTLQPSSADKKLTDKLKLAAQSLDIKVLDHLIVTQNAYFSFADEKLL